MMQHTPVLKTTAFTFLLTCLLFSSKSIAQLPEREISPYWHLWTSVNTTGHFTNRWGFIADAHLRYNLTTTRPDFYFARLGANYWVRPNISMTFGVAELWKVPTDESLHTIGRENRVFEQFLLSSKIGRTGLLQRIRNEQRWHQVISHDEFTGKWRFSNRVRYLMSFTVPLSSKEKKTSLVLSDEILIQFGKNTVYNTFEQNRIFAGFRSKLSKTLSCDYGYMNVYQQLSSGYQYGMYHTLRWFFYFNPDLRKDKTGKLQKVESREE